MHHPARFISILLISGLLVYPIPARSVSEDIFVPASDPNTGANGGFWFHFDDSGQLQYANGYAGTADWQATAFWSASGGWSFGEVTVNDPTVRSIFNRATTRENPFGDMDPTWTDPNYPTNPPTTTPGQKTCEICIRDLREDCRRVAASQGAVAVAAAGTFVATCLPPALPEAPATVGASIAGCAIFGIGILGAGVWAAKKQQKQCENAAPISCSDPGTGKPCYQLGYE